MNVQLNGYEIATVMQALQDADMLWDARIAEAQMGHPKRDNFSIEGARLLQDDLRAVMARMRKQPDYC